MLALKFYSVREGTKHLFLSETFDFFELSEASISTAITFSIDGHQNQEFFSGEEEAPPKEARFLPWKQLRPICFQIIKGKRTPLSFRFVFFCPAKKAAEFFQEPTLSSSQDIDGYLLNLQYKNGELLALTGCSYVRFSLDREMEYLWERYIRQFLKPYAEPVA